MPLVPVTNQGFVLPLRVTQIGYTGLKDYVGHVTSRHCILRFTLKEEQSTLLPLGFVARGGHRGNTGLLWRARKGCVPSVLACQASGG